MSLATTCPQCATTFKVAADQLKLRAGHVRCGACNHVFNALTSLLPIQKEELKSFPATIQGDFDNSAFDVLDPANLAAENTHLVLDKPTEEKLAYNKEDTVFVSGETLTDTSESKGSLAQTVAAENTVEDELKARASSEISVADNDLNLDLPSLHEMDAVTAQHSVEHIHNDAVRDVPGLHTGSGAAQIDTFLPQSTAQSDFYNASVVSKKSNPSRWNWGSKQKSLPRQEDPDFIRRAKREARLSTPWMQVFWWLAAAVLSLLLLLQIALFWRAEIAAHWPSTKDFLTKLCIPFACQVSLPARIEHIAIEGAELQKGNAAGQYVFSGTFRNTAEFANTWPHLELALTDATQQILLRKVFAPEHYLVPSKPIAAGINATSEHAFAVNFSVPMDANSAAIQGFRSYVFYP